MGLQWYGHISCRLGTTTHAVTRILTTSKIFPAFPDFPQKLCIVQEYPSALGQGRGKHEPTSIIGIFMTSPTHMVALGER